MDDLLMDNLLTSQAIGPRALLLIVAGRFCACLDHDVIASARAAPGTPCTGMQPVPRAS